MKLLSLISSMLRHFTPGLYLVLREWLRAWRRIEWHIRNLFRTYIEANRFPFDTTQPMPPTAPEWLSRTCEALERCGIRYALGWGTALGIVRDGRIIPHDTDMDINVIDVRDPRQLEQIMEGLGMTLGRRVITRPHLFGKKNTQQVVFYSPDRVKVDFLFWQTSERGPCLHNYMDRDYIIEHPRRFFEELTTVDFQGRKYAIPADIDGYFTNLYGSDWRTPRSFKNIDWRVDCKALTPRSAV